MCNDFSTLTNVVHFHNIIQVYKRGEGYSRVILTHKSQVNKQLFKKEKEKNNSTKYNI